MPSVILAVFPFGICSKSSWIDVVFSMVIIFSIFGLFIFAHNCFCVSLFIFGFPLDTLWVLPYIRLISLLPYGLYVCLVFYCLR